MKNLVLSAIVALGIFASAEAFAQANWDNRDTTVTADVTTARTFRSTMTCNGEGASWSVSCYDGDPCTRDVATGKDPSYTYKCCPWNNICLSNGQLMPEEQILAIDAKLIGLEEAFDPNQTATYWGYVSSTNRSPNLGRGTSKLAKLDVCLGSTDTDTALSGGSVSSCSQYCGSTNYNDYCTANGSAVCIDRCECALNDPGCNNL